MSFVTNNIGPHYKQIHKVIHKALEKRGIYKTTIKDIPKYCRTAGLTDISIHHVLIPLGSWSGQVGELMLDMVFNSLRSYREFVVKNGVFKDVKGEWDDHFEKLVEEINKNRCTVNAYVFTGRKPLIDENNENNNENNENGLFSEVNENDEKNENHE